MPQSSTATLPVGFGIFDFMTRVIPGALLSGVIIFIQFPGWLAGNVSTTELVLFGVASYVIGEFANTLRMFCFPVPVSFARLVYEQSDGQTDQHVFDCWRDSLPYLSPKGSEVFTQTQDEFWEDITTRLDLDEYEKTRDVYFLFLNYLEPSINLRTHRLQALYHLAMNLVVTGVFGVIIALYGILTLPDEYLLGSVFAIVLIGVVLFMIASFYNMIETLYIHHLLREYQAHKTEEKSQSALQTP